jgi:hypothetical protein
MSLEDRLANPTHFRFLNQKEEVHQNLNDLYQAPCSSPIGSNKSKVTGLGIRYCLQLRQSWFFGLGWSELVEERTSSVKTKCLSTMEFFIFSYSSPSSYLGRGTSYRLKMSPSILLFKAELGRTKKNDALGVIDNRAISIPTGS